MEKRSILRTLEERQQCDPVVYTRIPQIYHLPTWVCSLLEDLVPHALALVQVTHDILYEAQQGLACL